MKGCAIFVALMIGILGVGYGAFLLDRRDKEYEARVVGALRYVERTIENALIGTGDMQFFAPAIEPGAEPDAWRVTGIVGLPSAVSGPEHQPYSASLTALCDAYADPACWRLDGLTIGGRSLVDVVTESRGMARKLTAAPPMPAPMPAPAPAATPTAAPAADALGRKDKPAAATADQQTANQRNASPDASLVLEVQQSLRRAGFDPGPVDGIMGPGTRAAIEAYQRQNNLPADGAPSRELLRRLGKAR